MADAFIGEIRFYPYNFVPYGWQLCDGTLLSVQQWPALFAVIGTTFGGDGRTNFKVPNLMGLGVVGQGQGTGLSQYARGVVVGQETASITLANVPQHSHTITVQQLGYGQEKPAFTQSAVANTSYAGRYWFNTSGNPPYNSYYGYNPTGSTGETTPVAPVAMHQSSLSVAPGQSLAHENRQPYLPLLPCICLDGEFPINPNS